MYNNLYNKKYLKYKQKYLLYKQRGGGGGVININIILISGELYFSNEISSESALIEMLQDIRNAGKLVSLVDKDGNFIIQNNFITNYAYDHLVPLFDEHDSVHDLDLTITYTIGTSLEGFLNKHFDIIYYYDDRKYKYKNKIHSLSRTSRSDFSFDFSFELNENVNCEKLFIKNICIENPYDFKMFDSYLGLEIVINYKGNLLVDNKIQESKKSTTLLYEYDGVFSTVSRFTMIRSDEVTSLRITLPNLRTQEIILSINEYKNTLIRTKTHNDINTRNENHRILQNIARIISDSI